MSFFFLFQSSKDYFSVTFETSYLADLGNSNYHSTPNIVKNSLSELKLSHEPLVTMETPRSLRKLQKVAFTLQQKKKTNPAQISLTFNDPCSRLGTFHINFHLSCLEQW